MSDKNALTGESSERLLREIARVDDVSPLGAEPELVGSSLGRFRLVSLLGKGGMGVVYLAEDEALRRQVALKVLSPLAADDPERRRRLLREARAAAAVSHPSIAAVYDVGEDKGLLYIAMERISGETLRARIDRGPLGIDEAVRIARQVLEGLSKAHEAGFVHRDLKPDNVMVDTAGQVKILDFGLAKLTEETPARGSASTMLTEEGRLLGTPLYMSPEQAGGLPVSARSDLFSFGIVLYEMVTGERPFQGGNFLQVLASIERDEPAPPSRKNPATPLEIERVILRCLKKDPAARYESAREILRDLEAAKAPAPAARPARRWGAVAAVALAVAVAGVVGLSLQTRPATPAPVASASASAAMVPTAMTDLPLPATTNPEALAAYKRGLVKFRAGQGWAENDFRRAVELDPSFGAAYVRLVVDANQESMLLTGKREYAQKAVELSATLSERDRALLDAFDPMVRSQPSNPGEHLRRLSAMIERWPGDAELWHMRAWAHWNNDDFDAVIRDGTRTAQLDPRFGGGYFVLASAYARQGKKDEARRAFEACLKAIPTSTACMNGLMVRVAAPDGQCKEVEMLARRILSVSPEVFFAYFWLAEALASQAEPLPAAREAITRWEKDFEARGSASYKEGLFLPAKRLDNQAKLDIMAGDFESAEEKAREAARIREPSVMQSDHAEPAWFLTEILMESGKLQQAGDVAQGYLERRAAWEPGPRGFDFGLPGLLHTALRGGKISRPEFVARRDAWVRETSSSTRSSFTGRHDIWYNAYATAADGPEAAREALAVLPQYEPLPWLGFWKSDFAVTGRTHLFAGHVDEAIRWLEHGARHCRAFSEPIYHMRAHLWLGQALEQKNDKPRACAAYKVVLDRWSNAKPKSVTADEARARSKALGCSP